MSAGKCRHSIDVSDQVLTISWMGRRTWVHFNAVSSTTKPLKLISRPPELVTSLVVHRLIKPLQPAFGCAIIASTFNVCAIKQACFSSFHYYSIRDRYTIQPIGRENTCVTLQQRGHPLPMSRFLSSFFNEEPTQHPRCCPCDIFNIIHICLHRATNCVKASTAVDARNI
ncbi:unnamed protein product [Mesocestoides corti]|uniref:Uncharacterized protein n=1 Tax=Mesocestoides corti TaxID=53468 RepID=A0A0R3UBL6_MESCO|nr:unnamed protein product [Mesocestoides corti]